MKDKLKVVIVNGAIYIGELTYSDDKLTLVNAIQINMNPVNQQVSIIPPLFGKPNIVDICNPRNVIIYDVDDKIREQYEKAIMSLKFGIIPVKSTQLDNTKNSKLVVK